MKIKGVILLIVVFAFAANAAAETWHLTDSQSWQSVSDKQDALLMKVSSVNQLVSAGKTSQARKAFKQLAEDEPELRGGDYDIFVAAELLYSSGKYEKAATAYKQLTDDYPQSCFYNSALSRQYQIATAFLTGYKRRVLGVLTLSAYDEGGDIMNRIADKAGDLPIARNALTTLAETRETRGVYNEAYEAWTLVSDKWPTGQTGKTALLGMARSLELDYKGPLYDSAMLGSAKSYYQQYFQRYPEHSAQLNVKDKLQQLDWQLAEKKLTVADYYNRTDSFESALLYYQQIIAKWPQTVSAAEAEKKVIEVQKKIASASSADGKKKFSLKGLFL